MNILIVEDNKDLLEVISGLLAERGHTVTCKDNLADAMRYLRTEKTARIDVALIDFMLKGSSSERLVELIIEKTPNARIIMTSADTRHMKKSMEEFFAGRRIDAVIAKPYKFEVLVNLIQECSAPAPPAN